MALEAVVSLNRLTWRAHENCWDAVTEYGKCGLHFLSDSEAIW